MNIETGRLELICQSLDHIFTDSRYEFRTRWSDESLDSPLCKLCKYYHSLTHTWRGNKTLALDPYALESEVRDNFLSANESQKLNYVKLLRYKLLLLTKEEERVDKLFEELKADIEKGLVDRDQIIDFDNSRVSTFVYYIEDALRMARRVHDIVDENIEVFCPELTNQESNTVSANLEPGVKLQWNCSPAIAGYIISELVRAGYIEPPKTHGELSYAKLAGICNQLFDIRSDGKPTTLDYLKKVVNPESNPLPDYKRIKLSLPDLDQLT